MNYDNDFYARNLKFQTALARVLVPWLVKNLEFSSIADFGCGCGCFLKALADKPSVKKYVGINLDIPENLKIPGGHLLISDFRGTIDLKHKFDVVISLEVAEHLPESAADTYINSLARHAEKYILFSAATPGQGGVGHVNEQPPAYWEEKFNRRGWFKHDIIRPILKGKKEVPFWYRNNIYLYMKSK